MNILIYILIGIVIGYFGYRVLGVGKGGKIQKVEVTNKRFNREKLILEMLEAKEKITNKDVEKLLGVADSTATNYLQQLEDQGKIKQIGRFGPHVYYIFKR